jgi:fatty acid amide hydrolase 2
MHLCQGRSPHTLPALGLALLEQLPALLPSARERFLALGRSLQAELADLLGTDGVMLFPSHPRPAPRHGWPLLPPLQFGYTAIFNVMQLPVTQVPLGLDRQGRPLGVQVVGGEGQDHLTIAVALALEEETGGWIPPARWV